VQLPKETGELVMKAIEIAAAALTLDAKTAGDADAFFRQQADALVHLAQLLSKVVVAIAAPLITIRRRCSSMNLLCGVMAARAIYQSRQCVV
jgi:hypothetical protein